MTGRCPECGSTSFTAGPDGAPICKHCRTAYAPRRRECHRCGSAYGAGARCCPSCGAELARECPACGALIPLPMRQCLVCLQTACDQAACDQAASDQAACDQARDTADAMLARLTMSTQDQLRRVRQAGATIKAEEQVASRARLAEMWAEDEQRREELARARAERARRERLTVALALGVGATIIVIAIIAAVIATGGAPVRWP